MALKDVIFPKEYKNPLNLLESEHAIKLAKDTFEQELANQLQLIRVSAPLALPISSGLNDDLNGIEKAVSFTMKDINEDMEIIHSLAKWKRMALKRYGIEENHGLYTDMNAIRKDEDLDHLHSAYVDQWDWEKHIAKKDRGFPLLQTHVENILIALRNTQHKLKKVYPELIACIQDKVTYITTQELEDMYPHLTPKEREYQICKKHELVCLMQIGDQLKSGQKHDGRAPDYDDWSLNCDILIYYPILDCVVELSSMGIRVDEDALKSQLEKANCTNRLQLPFHQMLINQELPYSIGGGIGQSRICMVLLNKAHIGEVQVSNWPQDMVEACKKHKIELL